VAEWLVELQGHPAELAELADQFRSPRLNVRKEGERYYLRAPEEFDGSWDPGEVHVRATELIFLLSGIANLYAGAGETVTPGSVVIWERDDGTRDQTIMMKPQRIRVRSKVLVWGTEAIDPTVGESWLTLARQDDKVLHALRFFQEDTNWWSLRKAYEVLEKDEFKQQSKVAQMLSTPENEIRRFKEWTHYYVHGGRRQRPDPTMFPPLSLAEADSFLRELLKRWLRWKQAQQEANR
jgi:hypothetical protein